MQKVVASDFPFGVDTPLFVSSSLRGWIFSRPSKGNSRGNPRRHVSASLLTHVVAFMAQACFPRSSSAPTPCAYQYRDMSGDAASSATAAAAGEVRLPGMVQPTLSCPSLVTTASLNAPQPQPHFVQFSAEAISAAPSVDPSLEALLRSVNLCERLTTAFRFQEITDSELFFALDTSEE